MNSDPLINPWETQRVAMGAYIRQRRELANMSLRQLSQATRVSNAYLSQIERGLHDPTLRVLVQIGEALHLSIEEILREGARRESEDAIGFDIETAADIGSGPVAEAASGPRAERVEAAILSDSRLGAAEKEALLGVYRSYVRASD
ncbi:MAG: helix-turn-helix transcriptional regulator [Microlunatus sp.]|nr:helix-turn-helix transcriptional regulator [Microlunatus sp.]